MSHDHSESSQIPVFPPGLSRSETGETDVPHTTYHGNGFDEYDEASVLQQPPPFHSRQNSDSGDTQLLNELLANLELGGQNSNSRPFDSFDYTSTQSHSTLPTNNASSNDDHFDNYLADHHPTYTSPRGPDAGQGHELEDIAPDEYWLSEELYIDRHAGNPSARNISAPQPKRAFSTSILDSILTGSQISDAQDKDAFFSSNSKFTQHSNTAENRSDLRFSHMDSNFPSGVPQQPLHLENRKNYPHSSNADMSQNDLPINQKYANRSNAFQNFQNDDSVLMSRNMKPQHPYIGEGFGKGNNIIRPASTPAILMNGDGVSYGNGMTPQSLSSYGQVSGENEPHHNDMLNPAFVMQKNTQQGYPTQRGPLSGHIMDPLLDQRPKSTPPVTFNYNQGSLSSQQAQTRQQQQQIQYLQLRLQQQQQHIHHQLRQKQRFPSHNNSQFGGRIHTGVLAQGMNGTNYTDSPTRRQYSPLSPNGPNNGSKSPHLTEFDEASIEDLVSKACRDILIDAASHSLKAVELANTLRARVGTEVLAHIRERWGGLLSLLEKHTNVFRVDRIPKNDLVTLISNSTAMNSSSIITEDNLVGPSRQAMLQMDNNITSSSELNLNFPRTSNDPNRDQLSPSSVRNPTSLSPPPIDIDRDMDRSYNWPGTTFSGQGQNDSNDFNALTMLQDTSISGNVVHVSRCLYVGNIPNNISEAELTREFEKFGEIEFLKPMSQRGRRFSFICYKNVEMAMMAKQMMSRLNPWKNAVFYAHKECGTPLPANAMSLCGYVIEFEGNNMHSQHLPDRSHSASPLSQDRHQFQSQQHALSRASSLNQISSMSQSHHLYQNQNHRNHHSYQQQHNVLMKRSVSYGDSIGSIGDNFHITDIDDVVDGHFNQPSYRHMSSNELGSSPSNNMHNDGVSFQSFEFSNLPKLGGDSWKDLSTGAGMNGRSTMQHLPEDSSQMCPVLRRLCDDTYVPTQPWPIDNGRDSIYINAVTQQLIQFQGMTTISKLRGFLRNRVNAPDNIKSVPLKAMLAAYPSLFMVRNNQVTLLTSHQHHQHQQHQAPLPHHYTPGYPNNSIGGQRQGPGILPQQHHQQQQYQHERVQFEGSHGYGYGSQM